jgi:hypothetical protein
MKKISQTINVNISKEIDADITLGVDEIVNFISECNASEKNEILAALQNRGTHTGDIEIKTLDDILRFEVLSDAFKKYNIFELEERLK